MDGGLSSWRVVVMADCRHGGLSSVGVPVTVLPPKSFFPVTSLRPVIVLLCCFLGPARRTGMYEVYVYVHMYEYEYSTLIWTTPTAFPWHSPNESGRTSPHWVTADGIHSSTAQRPSDRVLRRYLFGDLGQSRLTRPSPSPVPVHTRALGLQVVRAPPY